MAWFWDNLALVAFLVLGFFAIWQLLAPTRRQTLGASVGAGVLALILGGWTLVFAGGTDVVSPGFLFYLFGGVAVVAAVGMIAQHNPVYAALWFAIVIVSVCGLFLLQSASFLAAATIIVYAGAIIVTFLFVIMLAQQTGFAPYDQRTREPFLATLAGFILLGALLDVLHKSYTAPTTSAQVIEQLARVGRRIDAKATDKQIDDAMYLADAKSVTALLEDEIKRIPSSVWPLAKKVEVTERFRVALDKWTTGKNAPNGRDPALMKDALATWQHIAQELERVGPHPSTLALPDSVRPYVASVPMRPEGPYVASLGQSLFGQYLFGVELAGTLLLIATIGSIAIVYRRKEAGT